MAVSEVADAMGMPIMADFLEDRGQTLHEIAVDTVFRFGATRALSEAIAKTGWQIADLGEEEVAEGITRMAVSAGMAERSEDLAAAGAELTAEGLVEMAAARGMHQAAEELVAEGAADIAAGASELTEAEMMAGLGGALEEAGEETEEPTD